MPVTVQHNQTSATIGSAAWNAAHDVTIAAVERVTLGGNTDGVMAAISSGTMLIAGGNNITLSQNANSVTISAFNAAAQTVESQSAGISNLGNTSGTSGIISGGQVRFLLAGGNNITLSQSINGASATVTISAPNLGAGAGYTAGMSNLGNSAGTTGVADQRLVFAGAGGITLSQSLDAASSSGTITISDNYGTQSFFQGTLPTGATVYGFPNNGQPMFFPMNYGGQGALVASRMNLFASISISTSSNSSHAGSITVWAGVYTRSVSTLNSLFTGSAEYQWTNTSDSSLASLASARVLSIPINVTITPGDYWIGIASRSSTGNTNWWSGSLMVGNVQLANRFQPFLAATNASNQSALGAGRATFTSASPMASIAFSDINDNASADHNFPYYNLMNATA